MPWIPRGRSHPAQHRARPFHLLPSLRLQQTRAPRTAQQRTRSRNRHRLLPEQLCLRSSRQVLTLLLRSHPVRPTVMERPTDRCPVHLGQMHPSPAHPSQMHLSQQNRESRNRMLAVRRSLPRLSLRSRKSLPWKSRQRRRPNLDGGQKFKLNQRTKPNRTKTTSWLPSNVRCPLGW